MMGVFGLTKCKNDQDALVNEIELLNVAEVNREASLIKCFPYHLYIGFPSRKPTLSMKHLWIRAKIESPVSTVK